MQFDSRNSTNGLPPLPDIKIVTSPYVKTEREKLMLAFAFMHCSVFEEEGDIEFAREGAKTGGFQRNMVPDDFQSFFSAYKRSEASGYHARCNVPDIFSPIGFSQFALISNGYDFMYNLMCLPDGEVLFHPGLSQNKALHEKIMNETFDLYEKVKQWLPIPPVKEKENEHPLKCYAVRKQPEKYKASQKDFFIEEDCVTLCQRPDFKFYCRKDILCCGQCEMLEKSYQMLIDEALEEETAAKLKKLVEEAGLFSKNEKGEPSVCHECQCGICKPHESPCSEKSLAAVEVIRKLWYCCYEIQFPH